MLKRTIILYVILSACGCEKPNHNTPSDVNTSDSDRENLVTNEGDSSTSTVGTVSAIDLAKMNSVNSEDIQKEVAPLGLRPLWDVVGTKNVFDRAQKNPQLKEALMQAKSSGVTVFPYNYFEVGDGTVFIDCAASDQEIIDFLLGKSQQK